MMSEAESSSEVSDQESIIMPEIGEMDIDHFVIGGCGSLTRCYLEVGGTVCTGFDIGWVSTLKIRLYYYNTLVGEITSPNMPVIPDSDNYWKTEWPENADPTTMRIKSMVGFKNFFCDIMPKEDPDNERGLQKDHTATLRVSPSGHRLTISIDLARMPRMRTTIKSLKISGKQIKISMIITNPSPLTLEADPSCFFTLKKGQDTIGELSAIFEISPGETECLFQGTIRRGVSGVVTLKGSHYESFEMDETWQQHVIKLFEVEINLDEFIVKTNGNGK
ncbi:hypothetical protein J3E68DRAFT_447787 [Trichoderma sp. SZMC 28012]